MPLQKTFGERTINELSLMFQQNQINLEPGFQRKSVWTDRDRQRLIQSVVSGYPVPSIFLYRRSQRGRLVYDVIDGKQRLETLLMFTRQGRFKKHGFAVRLDLGEGLQPYAWRDIRKWYSPLHHEVETYKIPTVEVEGELAQIVDLFVRINSTGKPLTSGEKRHAKFYESRFLKEADRLVSHFRNYFLKEKILSPVQLGRMKGTELMAELLASVNNGGIINKKIALDRAIGNESINAHTLKKHSKEVARTIKVLKGIVPDIRQTRFRNTADFYSLFMIVWELRTKGFVLKDRKRNKIAYRILRRLSDGVDELREQLRRAASPGKKTQRLYADYLLTVVGDTDSAANRDRRATILRGLLESLFDYKDDRRTFSSEQRRLLWNSEEKKQCKSCKKPLRWDDFTIDHVLAWIKGGKTKLDNAQLLCKSCNSSKRDR